jgi:pyruvate dehydrogenase E2 component (dihydrolipoamide acetyltransferase)
MRFTSRKMLTSQDDVEKYKSGSGASPSSNTTTPSASSPGAPAEYEDIPVSNMRRVIGKRLLESKQQVPHYYVTVEINMGQYLIHTRGSH